jgi:hypothetical protein
MSKLLKRPDCTTPDSPEYPIYGPDVKWLLHYCIKYLLRLCICCTLTFFYPNYTNHNIPRPVRKYLQKNDKYCLSVKILHIKNNKQ